MIRIGLAEAVITPELGVKMAGYAARDGVAEAVHDDLHVRALVLQTDETAVALVSAAVISLPQQLLDSVRADVSRQTDIPAANIMLAATHTHSGPVMTEAYSQSLAERTVETVLKAWEARVPGRVGVTVTQVEDVAQNRRRLDYGGVPVDPDVSVVRLEDTHGSVLGVLFHYACHPTTMGPDSLQISEDWVYYAIQELRGALPGAAVVMFLNGAEGDLNPGYSAALSAVGARIPIRTWRFAETIGRRVGRAVSEALAGVDLSAECVISSRTTRVDLPFRDRFPISADRAASDLERAKCELAEVEGRGAGVPSSVLDRARVAVFFAHLVNAGARWFYGAGREQSVSVELQSIRIGDAALTTLPGEVFVEIGLDIKRQSPFAMTLPIGLANVGKTGGYLPTREAFAEGDYEVYVSSYREDAGETLVQATAAQLNLLR